MNEPRCDGRSVTGARGMMRRGLHYFAGNIAAGAVGLIGMPVFTRLLSAEEYGNVNAYLAGAALLTTALTLNSANSISRYFYEQTDDFRRYLGSMLWLNLCLLVVGSAAITAAAAPVSRLTGIPCELVLFLPAATLTYIATSCYNQVLASSGRSRELATIKTLQGYSALGISALLVASVEKSRHLWRVAGLEAAGLLTSCYLVMRLVRLAEWGRVRWQDLRYSVHYALPRMPYVLSANILSSFDRVMIQSLSGAAKTGIYSVGYNLSNLVLLATQALTLAFMPGYYALMNEKRYAEVDRQNLLIIKILVQVSAAVVLFDDVLLGLLAERSFHGASVVIAPVVVGNTFFAIAQVYNRVISYAKRTALLSISALSAGMLNIGLNYLLIPRYGFVAAAYTTTASYAALASLSYLFARWLCDDHTTAPRLFLKPVTGLCSVVAIDKLVLAEISSGVFLEMMVRGGVLAVMLFALVVRDDGSGASLSPEQARAIVAAARRWCLAMLARGRRR